jgi:hypothetical protein
MLLGRFAADSARLRELAAFPRAASPFYREQYRALPEGVAAPALLPVTSQPQLMARFDDWVTDRAVTLAAVRAFIGNPDLIGSRSWGSTWRPPPRAPPAPRACSCSTSGTSP